MTDLIATPPTKSLTLKVNAGAVIAFIGAAIVFLADPANAALLSKIIPPKYFAAVMSVVAAGMAGWNLWRRFKTGLPIAGTQAAAEARQTILTALALPQGSSPATLGKVLDAVNSGQTATSPGIAPMASDVAPIIKQVQS